MCGRYTIGKSRLDRLETVFRADLRDISASYNVAPSQQNPVLYRPSSKPQLEYFIWGLVSHWLRKLKSQYRTFNAKIETVDKKPFYRNAYRHRRCLVPADGYYEWRKGESGKQPYYIHQGGAFAGLWEHWEGESMSRSYPTPSSQCRLRSQ